MRNKNVMRPRISGGAYLKGSNDMTIEKINDNPQCGGGIKTRSIAFEALSKAKANADAIDKLRNRLPVWATFVFGIMTFALGWTLNYAVSLSRLTGQH